MAKAGEVIGDGFFVGGAEPVFDAMGGGGGAECFEFRDGEEDGVSAVGDDIALDYLEPFIGEAIEELPGLVAAKLVNGPANAWGLVFGCRFRG